MKKAWATLSSILFWAFLWGIFEATAGCVLHLLPIKLGWLFWFPIAFYCMHKVYAITQKPWCVLVAAMISASFKLVDLIFPVRIDMVINPAMSILLESLAMFSFYLLGSRFAWLTKNKTVFALGINTAWRLLYLCYILAMPQWMIDISPLNSTVSLIKFLVTQNLVTSILIYLYLRFGNQIKTFVTDKIHQVKPTFEIGISKPVLQTILLLLLFSVDILLQFFA